MRLNIITILALFFLTACAGGFGSSNYGDNNGVTSGGLGAATPGSVDDFIINVGDRVFFELNKSDLSGEAKSTLREQAEWLNNYPSLVILIEGHCDERGTREYNIALGARRAEAVRSFLQSEGVDESRMDTISYGKEKPAALGANEAAWAQNRRSVITIH